MDLTDADQNFNRATQHCDNLLRIHREHRGAAPGRRCASTPAATGRRSCPSGCDALVHAERRECSNTHAQRGIRSPDVLDMEAARRTRAGMIP